MATDDDGLTLFDIPFGASPFRNDDESSVDIYDGLDSTSIVSDNPAQKSTPTRNCLNLFDEILIEEGTAKEANYNDLKAEYGKCQQQIKELMKKFKEVQAQNSILQNENQALKKNISALIKTARVEINRKDEEISNLHQRLSEFPNHRNNYTRTYHPGSTNTRCSEMSKTKDPKFRPAALVDNTKTDHRLKTDCSKEVHHSYSSHNVEDGKSYSERRNSPYLLRYPPERLCNDSARTCFPNFDHNSNKGNRRGREMKNGEQYSRANDSRYKRDAYQSTGNSTDSEQGNTDSHQKLQIYSEKSGKIELQQESKSKKLKCSPPVENRTDRCIFTWDKQTTTKERSQTTVESHGDEKGERSQNINRKDLETHDKDERNFAQKNKSTEKQQEQPRWSCRANSPYSKNENARSPHKSLKCPVEDFKRETDRDCKRDRGASDHSSREARSSPSTFSNREHKRTRSKESSSRYELETTYSKSERHRTEEKRKRDKENQEESRHPKNERKVRKEITHQTAKESKKVTDATKNERSKSSKPEETARVADSLKEYKARKANNDQNGTKRKDLKLSFMEKLNLTLSPAKTQSLCQNNGLETDSKKANGESSAETPEHTEMSTPAQPISIGSVEQTKSPLQVPVQTNLEPKTPVSEIKRNTENEALAETLDVVQPEALAEIADALQPELANDNNVSLSEAGIEIEEADKTFTAPELASLMNREKTCNIGFDDLETVSSDDFESHSVTDNIREMKSDSLMQVVDTNYGASGESFKYPAKENSVSKIVSYKDDMSTSEPTDKNIPTDGGVPVVDQNSCNLEPNLPVPEISVVTSSHSEKIDPKTKARETNPVPADDDNSILSIDLNHLRYIPKIISPLSSPMRPLAKALRMESPCKGLVKSYNKDLTPENTVVCPSKILSNEVNKENQKPVCPPDKHLEMESQLSISSDELEEGEIVSDDEESKSERNCDNSKISRGRASPETYNLISSPHNQINKTTSCDEDGGKLVYVKVSANKNREKPKSGATRSKERKKNKSVSIACLEKIVQIILEPSTVQEIMQMLKAVRKQIRKNYMKFKIHFPAQHFHRIIESAILNFTSLIKYLDFSKMSKLSETLKLTLCETIESKLRHVKKNATVEQLFEQQLSDMKKQLWKFVDEQLDYLFEKIKRILVKLCDLASLGSESDEGKLEIVTTQKQKCTTGHKTDIQKSRKKSLKVKSQKSEEYVLPKPVVNQPFNKCHHDKNKTDAPKNVITKCLNSIDNTRNSQTKVLPSKENNLQSTLSPLKSARYEKEGFHIARDTLKSDFNYELLTEQQTSSLTFNLVSDAQMGEIFKSLLQGSDLLEKSISSIDTDQWEFRTPEKQIPENQKCRNNSASVIEEAVPREACVKSRPIEDINWPAVSPERVSSLSSRLQMPVDPDVLDESCMFEVPSSVPSSKDDECSLQKNKPFVSSILFEDLAVSLTIPSPLKSDAHLSFLKPENTSSSTPEGVLSAHYSEDALLEEEDATEQDIHLALESDNSSSRSSSSWTSRPVAPGFHCDPSLPMQAVIMEKSNDHFIVKIRRTVPSTSPMLDQTSQAEELLVSLTKKEKEEIISARKKRDNKGTTGTTVEEKDSERDLNITDSTNELCNVSARQEQAHDLPELLKEPCSATGKEEAPHLYKLFLETSNKNSHSSENTSEDFKLPQMHELKVPENKREISNTTVESPVKAEVAFPSECNVDICIDLTEDIANESELDLYNLPVQSTLNITDQKSHTGNLDKGDTKEEPLECSVNAYIDLTEEISSEVNADECNSKTKSTLNVDLGCQMSLNSASKKRKKESLADNSKSKRQKKETESTNERNDKSSKKSEEKGLAPRRSSTKSSELPENKDLSTSSTSPRSLYAKNIIKKKGEVVVSWTRNDDREILLECQKNGPSGKTFVSIAARLNKSPNQVSERFKQLMKLFKKSKCK
ncbi:CASP8-associated protein 2 [Emydura macquarii macquarii]|uniref:CASP8-associated protein 2 n=1 Tax=Emydura macquarii macquarii TaxID=1129001 RepID=UPI00352B712F